MISVRESGTSEADALGRIMWSAIHEGPSLYTEAQRNAWCPTVPTGPGWKDRLGDQRIWVADAHQGFVTLADGGYVDFAYVLPQAQGRGVFRALMAALEAAADAPLLWTHASLMAQPAFAAMGFDVVHHEEVTRDGQVLERAKMEKNRT